MTSNPLPAQAPSLAEKPLPPSSLILCTRNRPQMLLETVRSILAADEVPTEIIIVDQSDEPPTSLEGMGNGQGCSIRHIHLNVIGASHARNAGLDAARYDLFALIDDDMVVTPAWYGVLMRALIQGGERSVVTGRIAAAETDRKDGFVIAVHDWTEPALYAGRIGRDVLASGHMALHRKAYLEVGGFDERLGPGTRFPGAEDNDYGFRLLEAGFQIRYEPDSLIYHRAWRACKDYVPLFWSYGRGQGAFYAKHWRWRDGYMAKRAGKDIGRYLSLFLRRIWERKLLVLTGATVFLLGEAWGALVWRLSAGKGARWSRPA